MQTLFGTDGIRGRVGTSYFVPEQLINLGKAIAVWAQQKYGHSPKIVLTHDTRISCAFVKASLKSGLLQYPIEIFDTFILPTPAMAHLLQAKNGFDCAIIISASHNPYEDNGIKIIAKDQGKLTSIDEQIITQLFINPVLSTAQQYGLDNPYPQADIDYCNLITSYFPSNMLKGITVVLDVAHGATYQVAPKIFQQLGAQVITIHNKPNGYNINKACGALELNSLQQAIIEHQADIGFAFDGDGDRVIAVNRHGAVKNGDDILALLIEHPDYHNTPTIVGTIMTNQAMVPFLQEKNKKLIRTCVGDKYIAEQLAQHNLLLGGEPSGHIILQDMLNTGDGILVALKLLETLQQTENWDLETFEPFPQIIMNVPIVHKKDLQAEPCRTIIETAQQQLDGGRVLVRYSGTEPLLRVMVESSTCAQATEVCKKIAHALTKVL